MSLPRAGIYLTKSNELIILSKRDGPYQVFNKKTKTLEVGEVALYTLENAKGIFERVRIDSKFNCERIGSL